MEPANLLRKSARLYGDNIALAYGDREQTYSQLLNRAIRLANVLGDAGIKPGDRVAMLGDNAFESLEQIAGLAIGNVVRCALYAHDTPDKHRYLLELTGARALIVQDKYVDAVRDAIAGMPDLQLVLVLGDTSEGTLDYEQALASAPDRDPEVSSSEDDPHVIRFSAGTTGKPKGILHTGRGWMDMGTEMALVVPRFTEHDRYLVPAPLSHAAGLFVWPLVAAGAAIVPVPAFDAGEFLRLVEQQRATITLVVPTIIRALAEHPDATTRDLNSLHTVIYGTAPISEATLTAGIGLWGNIMYQIYGQSEALPLTVLTPEHHVIDGSDAERRRLRSAGRPTPNADIAILDEDGNRQPVGEVGEVAGCTPGRMREIWADPTATAERITADGWIRTRDMGWMSGDGFVYLTDRKEDTIISGGYNIWPTELETALLAHPGVYEAAVVGIPDPKWGETPHAAVVLQNGAAVTEDELVGWTRDRLGSVRKITGVTFVEELPRSPIGKVLRREVRAHVSPGAAGLSGA